MGTSPDAVAIGSGKIYVANRGSDNVSIIKIGSTRVKKTVGVGTEPDGIAVTDDVYVTNYGSDTVSVLSPRGSLLQTIARCPLAGGDRGRQVVKQ